MNSTKAAEYFCSMEKSKELKSPVAWVFVRPPWSTATVCRKAYVVKHLLKLIDKGQGHPHLFFCVGKVFQLFEDDEQKRISARDWLQRAADRGLPHAMFDLWKMELEGLDKRGSIETLFASREPGLRLSLMRNLRQIAATGHEPAQVQLCQLYASGHHEGVSAYCALKFMRDFFSNSSRLHSECFSTVQSHMTVNMRFILVDWLIEVATMKGFSSKTLHATVQCVDRYLRLREISRSYIQLLGIACMVVCSRGIEKDVLTIREAVWLTDSAYKYEELVRMMQDVVSTLRGNILRISSRDYLSVFLKLEDLDAKVKAISEFVNDASLLYADASMFSPAILASACVMLASSVVYPENPWNTNMVQLSGFSKDQLATAALQIHEKCFSEQQAADDLKFEAIEERYSQGLFGPIKRNKMVTYEQLCSYLSAETEVPIVETEVFETPSDDIKEFEASTSSAISHDFSGTKIDESSDEEFETDTPPTLSCAYLVKTDTKARKRIRDNHIAQASASNVLTLRENAVHNATTQKIHPKKQTILLKSEKPDVKDQIFAGKDKSTPRLAIVLEKENIRMVKKTRNSTYSAVADAKSPCLSKTKSMR